MSVRLLVGNVPFPATELDLKTFFSSVQIVPQGVTIVRDRFTTEPKGYAWVDVETEEEAERAITQLRGRVVYNRVVVVARQRAALNAIPEEERSAGVTSEGDSASD